MKKILNLAFLLLACFVISSCSDAELATQAPVARDYQTDAQILSKFVDVNKTIGEYYINENKKNSPLAYISNKDWQELQEVNPANRAKFENDLNTLNSQLETTAKRPEVSQIVYNTYGETWIRTLQKDASIMIEKSPLNETEVTTRSTWATLQLQYNARNEANFYAGNQIKSKISINMLGYKYYYFEIDCKIDASKTPEGGYTSGSSDNPQAIVISGSGSMEAYNFTWKANSSDSDIFWKFKGYLYNPQNIGECLISTEFMDDTDY